MQFVQKQARWALSRLTFTLSRHEARRRHRGKNRLPLQPQAGDIR
jgi:hypothetical protein